MNLKDIITLCLLSVATASCGSRGEWRAETAGFQDTVIVKQKEVLDSPYTVDFYSKSYAYYWLAGKDTLNFTLHISEYKADTTFSLRVHHTEPVLFTTALEKVEECLPLIGEDFDVSKLASFGFMPPVYYLDLANMLSGEYEQEFGRKNITHKRLNQFLLQSGLNSQLNVFFNPLHKKVKRYWLEKFHLIDKESYKGYLPDINLSAYPDFTLNVHMGMWVDLEDVCTGQSGAKSFTAIDAE